MRNCVRGRGLRNWSEAVFLLSVVGSRFSVVGFLLSNSVVGCGFSVFGCRLLVFCCGLSVVGWRFNALMLSDKY